HAERASVRYGVDVRSILVELAPAPTPPSAILHLLSRQTARMPRLGGRKCMIAGVWGGSGMAG
ncbi:hypothetical protein AB0J84_22290, partial [Micromonospora arborensis]|uniref:hypothetical protein n=1 Tax=Micromonospora arborensis TaxID=2116518 RepID=UPI0034320827